MRFATCTVLLGLLLGADQARAQAESVPPASLDEGRRPLARQGWPVAAALVPGVLVHGSGHFVAGERRTGLRLAAMGGVGLAGMVGGILSLWPTGAAKQIAGPAIGLTMAGGALFTSSLFGDLYGLFAPAGGTGRAPSWAPRLEAAAGLLLVHDPVFPHTAFSHLELWLGWRWLRAGMVSDVGLDRSNQRLHAPLRLRLPSGQPGRFLELELAATHHRYGPQGFAFAYGEIVASGRIGLDVLGPTLAGAFLDGGLGVALGAIRYDGLGTERDEMLLGRFGTGMYFGHDPWGGGEARLYYDHRHDGFAGGMKMPGLGSGTMGHVGLGVRRFFGPRWGASLDMQAGSAYLATLAVVLREVAPP
jgi:hypothetical protein